MNFNEKEKKETNNFIADFINNQKIAETLLDFANQENNKQLSLMVTDLINYYKNIRLKEDLTVQNDVINFKIKLYSYLQKNVLEAIYIKDKEKREQEIRTIYLWYKDKIKCFNKLRCIRIKKYISSNEIDDDIYFPIKYKDLYDERKKMDTDRDEKDLVHRSAIFQRKVIDSLNDYKTRHIMKLKDLNYLKLKSKLVRGKCGYIDKKDMFELIDDETNKEKDFILPFMLSNAEKGLIECRNKLYSEKRNREENEIKIREFSKNKAIFKTNLINKCEMKNLIKYYSKNNNIRSLFLKKSKALYKNVNDEEKSSELFSLYNIKDINNEDNDDNININEEDNQDDSEVKRRLNKSKSEKIGNNLKKYLKILERKIIVNEIQNLDKKTNKIIDQPKDKIISNEIILKNAVKKENKEQIFNRYLNNTIIPPDSVSTLLFRNRIFRQKLINRNLLNISNKKELPHQAVNLLEKTSIENENKLLNNNKLNLSINLSAYNTKNIENIKNLKFLNEYKKSKIISQKEKILKLNTSFNLYRNNYLSLRKSISEMQKKEFEKYLYYSSIKKNVDTIGLYDSNQISNKELSKSKNESTKNFFITKKIDLFRDNSHEVLCRAILNPDESNVFSRYYLPRSGSMLLVSNIKNQIKSPKKKKQKKS